MQHIIATVGTNPLPVLIALCRLCKQAYAEGRAYPAISFLHSNTRRLERQAQTIRSLLARKLDLAIPQNWRLLIVDPTDAKDIAAKLASVAEMKDPSTAELHYTGGRKFTGYAVQRQIFARTKELCAASYLDPNEHCLKYDDSRTASWVPDERPFWSDLTLVELADLHGFSSTFEHKWYSGKEGPQRVLYGPPTSPEAEIVAIAEAMFPVMRQNGTRNNPGPGRQATEWFESHVDEVLAGSGAWPPLPNQPGWDSISERVQRFLAANPNRRPQVKRLLTERAWLELAAYAALDRVGAKLLGTDVKRELFQSVHFRESFRGKDKAPFELDVVALFSYQLLVVSCAATGDPRKEVKVKGFEAVSRAVQIGGGAAHAILLTLMDRAQAKELEDDIQDTQVADDRAITVWSRDHLQNLDAEFEKFIRGVLNWNPKNTPASV